MGVCANLRGRLPVAGSTILEEVGALMNPIQTNSVLHKCVLCTLWSKCKQIKGIMWKTVVLSPYLH